MLQKRADIAALLEGNHDGPIFTEEWLIVELKLYFNRPRHHMKQRFGLQCLPERVRNSFEFLFVRRVVDVDNVAKFLLDCMTGPICTDDRQVVKLIVTKIYDNRDDCFGRTTAKITEITSADQLGLRGI